MRRLLVTLLIALSTVVVFDMPAHACSCAYNTLADRVDNSDVAFVGTVTTRVVDPAAKTVTYTVDVTQQMKGEVPDPATVRTSTQLDGSCGLPQLAQGRDYALIGTNEAGVIEVNSCGGTTLARRTLVAQLVQLTGASTDQSGVELTPVTDGQPASFPKLALPGAVMLVVGGFGLLVTRKLR